MRIFAGLLLAGVAYASNSTEPDTTTAAVVGGGSSSSSGNGTTTGASGGTSGSSGTQSTATPTQDSSPSTAAGSSGTSSGSTAESTAAANSTSGSSTAEAGTDYESKLDLSFADVGTANADCPKSTGFANTVLISTMCATQFGLLGSITNAALSTCNIPTFACTSTGAQPSTSTHFCLTRPAAPTTTGLFSTMGTYSAADNLYGSCSGRRLSETRRLQNAVTMSDKVTIKVPTAKATTFAPMQTALNGVSNDDIAAKVNKIQGEVVTAAAAGGTVGGLAIAKVNGGNTVTFTGMNVTATVTKAALSEVSAGGSTSSAASVILSGAALVGAALMF